MSKKIKNMGSTRFERFLKYIEKVEKETITKVDKHISEFQRDKKRCKAK